MVSVVARGVPALAADELLVLVAVQAAVLAVLAAQLHVLAAAQRVQDAGQRPVPQQVVGGADLAAHRADVAPLLAPELQQAAAAEGVLAAGQHRVLEIVQAHRAGQVRLQVAAGGGGEGG
ncbi:hypothetical protein scyTo_0026031 [Scyliorhinus torazame]|uniref:Uncharacterized protein n=1 Tax=Scyliorhinus torazame TaxID=75743 RepID=A0A401QJ69_SCYTO|nr:hypothetical protein [Scyliorhinus torazame]